MPPSPILSLRQTIQPAWPIQHKQAGDPAPINGWQRHAMPHWLRQRREGPKQPRQRLLMRCLDQDSQGMQQRNVQQIEQHRHLAISKQNPRCFSADPVQPWVIGEHRAQLHQQELQGSGIFLAVDKRQHTRQKRGLWLPHLRISIHTCDAKQDEQSQHAASP